MIRCDLLVVGAGPAGLFGTYYAGIRGLEVVLIDSLTHVGGQVAALYPDKLIYDVAGMPAVQGRDLISGLVHQAQSARPHVILGQECTTIEDQPDGSVVVTTSAGARIHSGAVLLTSGIGRFTPRPLPAVDSYAGGGIHRVVAPPGEYAEQDVVVVGGGDSAVDWANMLVKTARTVTLIHRRERFTAHESSVDELRTSGCRIITGAEILDVDGEPSVERVLIKDTKRGAIETVPASVVIPALGHIASLGPLLDWGLTINGRQIQVDTDMGTGRSRVYAAGDITDYPGKVRLMVVGFGEAATAVNNIAVVLRPDQDIFPGHSSELPRMLTSGKRG